MIWLWIGLLIGLAALGFLFLHAGRTQGKLLSSGIKCTDPKLESTEIAPGDLGAFNMRTTGQSLQTLKSLRKERK